MPGSRERQRREKKRKKRKERKEKRIKEKQKRKIYEVIMSAIAAVRAANKKLTLDGKHAVIRLRCIRAPTSRQVDYQQMMVMVMVEEAAAVSAMEIAM